VTPRNDALHHESLLVVDLYLLSKFYLPTFPQREFGTFLVSSIEYLSGLVLYLVSNTMRNIILSPIWWVLLSNGLVDSLLISNVTIKGSMPICLKFVNCQHCWQKAIDSRLFCSTVAWGRPFGLLLALPLLVKTPPRICCISEHGGSTPGTEGTGADTMELQYIQGVVVLERPRSHDMASDWLQGTRCGNRHSAIELTSIPAKTPKIENSNVLLSTQSFQQSY